MFQLGILGQHKRLKFREFGCQKMRKKKKHEKQCQPTGISLSNMYFLNRNITLNYVFSYWDFGDLLKLYDTQGKCLICLTLVLILSAKDELYIFWIVFSGQSWTREQMIYFPLLCGTRLFEPPTTANSLKTKLPVTRYGPC